MQLDKLGLGFKQTLSMQEPEYKQTIIAQKHLSYTYEVAQETIQSLNVHASILELVCNRMTKKRSPDEHSMINPVHEANREVNKDLSVLFQPIC